MVMLAAYGVLLSRWSGQTDIVVGSPIAGRTHRQTEGLIGLFVNTLVMRVGLSGNPRFEDLLDQVKQAALEAYAHQDIPFEKLVEELQPARDLSRQPIYQVGFVFQNQPREHFAVAGLRSRSGLSLGASGGEPVTAKLDLGLYLYESPSGLRGAFEYATDLFDRETIERLVSHFETLLSGIVAAPEKTVGQLPLLSEAERELRTLKVAPVEALECVEGFERFEREQIEQSLVQRFVAQVARDPGALAVQDGDEQWSYQRLDR